MLIKNILTKRKLKDTFSTKTSEKEKQVEWLTMSLEYRNFIKKIFIIVIFIVSLAFIYQISSIIIIFLFSVFLNILFSPLLNRFNRIKIPDILGIIIIYIFIILFLVIIISAILPIFVEQLSAWVVMIQKNITEIIQVYNVRWIDWLNLPNIVKTFIRENNINFTLFLDEIKNNLWPLTTNLKLFLASWIWMIGSITSMLANAVMVFIFTFFIALERHNLKDFFYKIIPTKISLYIQSKESEIVYSISTWFRWQAILWICIFVCIYVWLTILKLFGINLENNFTLALIAWMMEFIPYIWPTLSAIPAIIIAIGISYKSAIVVIILYIIIQEIENNILVPFIMWKNLALSPFAVLIAMTIWASIFGIVWIIIAIPVVAISQIFIRDYMNRKR